LIQQRAPLASKKTGGHLEANVAGKTLGAAPARTVRRDRAKGATLASAGAFTQVVAMPLTTTIRMASVLA
jgi:hypothetical protein